MEEDNVGKITEPIKSNKPGSMLSRLFRQILMELGYTPARFNKMLNDYVVNTNKRAKYTKYISSVSRSHVLRKLVSDDFTWKVFIMAIFQFLNVKKMKLTVELTHSNNKVTVHSIKVVTSDTGADAEETEINK